MRIWIQKQKGEGKEKKERKKIIGKSEESRKIRRCEVEKQEIGRHEEDT